MDEDDDAEEEDGDDNTCEEDRCGGVAVPGTGDCAGAIQHTYSNGGGCSYKRPIGAQCEDDDNDCMTNSYPGWGWSGVADNSSLAIRDDVADKKSRE